MPLAGVDSPSAALAHESVCEQLEPNSKRRCQWLWQCSRLVRVEPWLQKISSITSQRLRVLLSMTTLSLGMLLSLTSQLIPTLCSECDPATCQLGAGPTRKLGVMSNFPPSLRLASLNLKALSRGTPSGKLDSGKKVSR